MFGESNVMKDPAGYLTPEQIHLILDACETLQDKLLIKTLFISGRRISELVKPLGPTPSDINFNDGLISWNILKKKKKKIAVMPVPSSLLNDLKGYIEQYNIRPTDLLFNFTRVYAFYKILFASDRAVKKYPHEFNYEDRDIIYSNKPITLKIIKVGKTFISPHMFRHSSGVFVQKATGDVRRTQLHLQHSNIMVTQTYLRYSNNDMKETANKFEGV